MFAGTRDLAGSRHGALGRSDLDLDFEPSPASARRPLPPFSASDPFFDDAEDTVFDIRGQRTSRGPRRQLGDEFASEVASTANRLKARLQVTSDQIEDKFAESARSARAAMDEADSAFRRRARFGTGESEAAELLDEVRGPGLSAKWTKLADAGDVIEDFTSAAASRAKKSKARLNDLEHEMEEMAEKQARREKRSAALRALVNEANAAADESLGSALSSSSTSVQHRSEKKTEKHVSF